MDEQNVSISDDALTIENCVIDDHDIVAYFENAQNQNKDLDEILENILKLGVIASKSAQVGNQVDFVEKKFMAIQNNLENQLNEQFGTQGDSIKESMTDMFHKLGVELGINQAIQNEHEKGSQKGLEFEQYCEEYISILLNNIMID